MIQVRNTENLVGITILGDFEDLNALHDAICDYAHLHMSNYEESEQGDHFYNCILSLCYDIRRAYQGSRDFESVPNNSQNIANLPQGACERGEEAEKVIERHRNLYKNGNLYFSVNIFYPWAVYYLFALQSLTEDSYASCGFEDLDFQYDDLEAERDEALIQYFVLLLWECVKKVLPEETFTILRNYTTAFNHKDFYVQCPDMYLQWLCHYWVSSLGDKKTRRSMLPMLCLELTPIYLEDEELLKKPDLSDKLLSELVGSLNQNALRCIDLYNKTFEASQSTGASHFRTSVMVYAELNEYVNAHGSFTGSTYDDYLIRKFGPVDWNSIEW